MDTIESIREIVIDLKARLFGLDGESGLIGRIQRMHDSNTAKIDEIEKTISKWKWLALGIFITWSFLTSSGFVSLKTVLEILGSKGK